MIYIDSPQTIKRETYEGRYRANNSESFSAHDSPIRQSQDGARRRVSFLQLAYLYIIEQGGAVMTCNVGGVERPIRIVVGIALLGIGAFAGLPPVGTGIALVVGTIALVTGAIGSCPVWTLMGINTCPAKRG
jgi:hypothetical protein